MIATRGALGNSVFFLTYYQISKEAFSLQATCSYQALYNIALKPFSAIKPYKQL